MGARRMSLVLILITALAACGPAVPGQATPRVAIVCDPMQWDPPSALTCEAAVNAAVSKVALGGRGPIVRVTFRYGPWCPPNARCFVGPIPDRGYVVFEFDDRLGSIMVDVGVDGGRVWAGEPQPAPEGWRPDGQPVVGR